MQYQKLFDYSGISYIHPFSLIWMSFEKWLKEDLKSRNSTINRKKDIIQYYQKTGKVIDEFIELFESSSDSGIHLKDALHNLILNLQKYPITDDKNNVINYSDVVIDNYSASPIEQDELQYISYPHTRFSIRKNNEQLLFADTLDILYRIRCSLFHGDFDVDNQYFQNIIENAYKILYPIMKRILEKEKNEFFCIDKDNNIYTTGLFNKKKESMTVLKGSRVSLTTGQGQSDWIGRLRQNAIKQQNYYEIIQDIDFPSPSAASSFCLGKNSYGSKRWKSKSGETIKDIWNI